MNTIENTKQEVGNALIEVLARGAESIGEQVPLVIQELLLYNGLKHGVVAFIFGVCLCYCVRSWKKHDDQYESTKTDKNEEVSTLWMVSLMSSVVFLTATIYNLYILGKIILFPRLYLLEYASQLVI